MKAQSTIEQIIANAQKCRGAGVLIACMMRCAPFTCVGFLGFALQAAWCRPATRVE